MVFIFLYRDLSQAEGKIGLQTGGTGQESRQILGFSSRQIVAYRWILSIPGLFHVWRRQRIRYDRLCTRPFVLSDSMFFRNEPGSIHFVADPCSVGTRRQRRRFSLVGPAIRTVLFALLTVGPCLQCHAQEQKQQPKQDQQIRTNHTNTTTTERFKVSREGIEIIDLSLPERPTGELGFKVLETLCDIGSRTSGSEGMLLQQRILRDHFENLGATVSDQLFTAPDPISHELVTLNNLIVRWHPERSHRILVCCHYDTLPFPNADKINPRGLFVGANDGASGVGLLCELGRYMPSLESEYGVDFVFFDGEEFVYERPRDPLFLGSTFFARQYAANPHTPRYSAGVLVDMIGDKDLKLYWEKNSYKHAREITRQIWNVAADLEIKEFIPRTQYEIRDDHLPLIEIAGIPTCDIIDFDFPVGRKNIYWHTEEDTPDKCSAESLGKVSTVILQWLKIIRVKR